jgi:hypothetical protein
MRNAKGLRAPPHSTTKRAFGSRITIGRIIPPVKRECNQRITRFSKTEHSAHVIFIVVDDRPGFYLQSFVSHSAAS